jgi:hypothetical protein
LTRCFLDWFKQTPAGYRAANRPATLRDNEIEPVAAEATAALIREHRRRIASPTAAPRLSITPILLKNIGSRADLFEKIRTFQSDGGSTCSRCASGTPSSGLVHARPSTRSSTLPTTNMD